MSIDIIIILCNSSICAQIKRTFQLKNINYRVLIDHSVHSLRMVHQRGIGQSLIQGDYFNTKHS